MEEEAKKFLQKMWAVPADMYEKADMVIYQVSLKKLAGWLVDFARSQQIIVTRRDRMIWFLNGFGFGLAFFLIIYYLVTWSYGVDM